MAARLALRSLARGRATLAREAVRPETPWLPKAALAPMATQAAVKAAVSSKILTGYVVNQEIGDEKTQKDYYDKASHYDLLWGEDNIHLGYYPHLSVACHDPTLVLDNKQASDALTKRMVDLAHINHKTNLLDLGCGKGQSIRVMHELTGAKCTGIDLSSTNIDRANQWTRERGLSEHLTFYEGSFTALPQEVLSQKYDVIFSQVAFCHVHSELIHTFLELRKVLAPGGIVVVNDYLGCDLPGGASQRTKQHTWKRLHFEYLHGHVAWRRIAEDAGFVVEYYENLDRHMVQTYLDMAKTAEKYDIKSTDGTNLCENYRETAKAIQDREVGMNLCLISDPSAPSSK